MSMRLAVLGAWALVYACAADACPEGHVCGRIVYERRTESGELERTFARHLRVTLARAGGGRSSVQLAPEDGGAFALPMVEGGGALELVVAASRDRPRVLAAEALDAESLEAGGVWTWRFPVCARAGCGGAIALGELAIEAAQGAGAAHAFDWVVDTHAAVGAHESTREIAAPSLLVLWRDGLEPDCGSCYVPRALGGAELAIDGASERFECVLRLGGGPARPAHWARSTIAHEASHWILEGYSRWPGDLSAHDPARPARPGVAYTEGFATFHGQASISAALGVLAPRARFTTREIDLEHGTVDGSRVPAPSAQGAVD